MKTLSLICCAALIVGFSSCTTTTQTETSTTSSSQTHTQAELKKTGETETGPALEKTDASVRSTGR